MLMAYIFKCPVVFKFPQKEEQWNDTILYEATYFYMNIKGQYELQYFKSPIITSLGKAVFCKCMGYMQVHGLHASTWVIRVARSVAIYMNSAYSHCTFLYMAIFSSVSESGERPPT